ncbi:MAG: hypothetical protein GXP41_00415 [Chloroflexi bacterium]|nr:hypothetical protein [Chloroflexota bacterium]
MIRQGVGMGRVVRATEARIRFGELMRRAVESRETITGLPGQAAKSG